MQISVDRSVEFIGVGRHDSCRRKSLLLEEKVAERQRGRMWWSAKQQLDTITGTLCPTPHQSFARASQMPASPQGEALGAKWLFIILLRFCALRRPAACFLPPYSKVCIEPLNANFLITACCLGLEFTIYFFTQWGKCGIITYHAYFLEEKP